MVIIRIIAGIIHTRDGSKCFEVLIHSLFLGWNWDLRQLPYNASASIIRVLQLGQGRNSKAEEGLFNIIKL